MNGEDLIERGLIETHQEIMPNAVFDTSILTGVITGIMALINGCKESSASRQIKRGKNISKRAIREVLERENYQGDAREAAKKLAEKGRDLTDEDIKAIIDDSKDVPPGNSWWPTAAGAIVLAFFLPVTAMANWWPTVEAQQASISSSSLMWPKPVDKPTATPVTEITIHVSPSHCPPCDRVKAMDWSGFNVKWETGGAVQAYPEFSWRDDGGRVRYLAGAHTPGQVLSSISQTRSPGVDYAAAQAPTPYSKINEGLEISGLKPGQTFVDIGCGDGRALMIAAEQFNASRATGVEIDPNQVSESRLRTQAAGLSDRIEIIEGDATKVDLPVADVAYVYLYPETLGKLKSKLERFGTVVSYLHQVPGLPMQKRGDFYVWTRGNPQAVQAQQVRRQRSTAVWNGVAYSGPVCNSPNCRMCNSIRSQLRSRK